MILKKISRVLKYPVTMHYAQLTSLKKIESSLIRSENLNYLNNESLISVGVTDNKSSSLSKLDQKCNIMVKCPVGVTENFTLNNIVMQGSVFAPLKCTTQIDSLGRDCLSSSEEDINGLYRYRGVVDIPPSLWWTTFWG